MRASHHRAAVLRLAIRLAVAGVAATMTAGVPTVVAAEPAATPAMPVTLIDAAGTIERSRAGTVTWERIRTGETLATGDRIRTGTQSRAAVQFSDRSVVRLGENTTLQVQPPVAGGKRRFGLFQGLLYFFNRERPSDVEFETPISSGAIRGTEFVLDADDGGATTRLALLDGHVELTAAGSTIQVTKGELATVTAGNPPSAVPLVNAVQVVQWALYYPAVVIPADLPLDDADRTALAAVLGAYQAGDIRGAVEAMAAMPPGNAGRELFRTALELSVGRLPVSLEAPPFTGNHPVATALRELISVIQGDASADTGTPSTATGWLARSYRLQSSHRLEAALEAASQAARLAPDSGIALARRAELELMLERRRDGLKSLAAVRATAPRLSMAAVLEGFARLDGHEARAAFDAFEQALALDTSLGSAWLGRGLAQEQLGRRELALRDFQVAAALEPRRSLHRTALGKAYSRSGQVTLAEKDLRLARELDPADPTPWFYSALHHWQELRPMAAVRSLEESIALNDNRQLFRSRLALDRDLAVRSANLAAMYRDAGLPEAAQQSAATAVAADYANFSSHLFLARSYQLLEDPRRIDLRYEAARQSEFTVASLLAPAGAGGLSQLSLQPEHIEWFDTRPVSFGSFTEYRSSGDWLEEASIHGAFDGFSYALNGSLRRQHGEEPNGWLERDDLSLQLKQRVTDTDEAWFQAGVASGRQGDVARRLDPGTATLGFRAADEQLPNLRAGWHHRWSPSSHTLLLVGRLTDFIQIDNPQADPLFVRQTGGVMSGVSTAPFFRSNFDGRYTVSSAELQHLWQAARHTVVAGARIQSGDIDNDAVLERQLTGVVTDQRLDASMARAGAYLYETWNVAAPLRLIAGLSYDHLRMPLNSELPPLSTGNTTRDRWSPKAGLVYTPWKGGEWRAAFTRSLGGLYFDSNLQLEPSQLAGFPQIFRSLVPESVVGLVPGSEFDTVQWRFDQALKTGTHFGAGAAWMHSDGARVVGVLTNSLPLPVPNAASSLRQDLEFRERTASAYVVQWLGDGFSAGIRYRLSDADLEGRFPGLPGGIPGADALAQNERATLHEVRLTLNYQHPSGFFARWESHWFQQSSAGYTPAVASAEFWQHDLWAGWRLFQRQLEVRLGVLNLAGDDYRLNPLNEYGRLPRHRTFVASLRVEF